MPPSGEVLSAAADDPLVRGCGGGRDIVGVQLADGSTLTAHHIVAAVPPHSLRRLMPATWSTTPTNDDLERFEPGPYISVYMWFDQKLSSLAFWARPVTGNTLNTDFYDLSNINPAWKDQPSVVASNIIYSHRADSLSDDDIVSATRAELAEFLPAAPTAELRHSVVNRIPMAIMCPLPGVETARPPVGRVQNRLVLAGDWTATGLPCSMESAALSGWRAARAILTERGITPTLSRRIPLQREGTPDGTVASPGTAA